MRQFFTFCSHMNITLQLPVNEDILINFSVAMARSVQYSTIKNYLSAVKNYHSSHGYELHLSNFLRLRLILRGIKRSHGQQSKVRRPITLQLLNLFYHLLNVQHTNDSVWIVAFGKKIAHFVGFGREIGVVTAKSTKPEKLRVRN